MRAKRRMAGLLAAGVTAALACSGAVGASSALACTGTTPILGQGSSLQKIAQETWTNVSTDCVTYTASGSGAGLKAFGVGKMETPESSKDVFIGTDDAPNAEQLKEIDKAANGTGEKGQAIVIPVAQAAIAIIAHPPSSCTITQIENEDLEKVFDGTFKTWSQIKNASGSGCSGEITRVVREDPSGTTYQFKHYLFEVDKAVQAEDGSRTWAELQPEPTANVEWPKGGTLSKVVTPTNKGGQEVVTLVKSDSGSIGYANVGDAEANETSLVILKVQNETGKENFTAPVRASKEANCSGTNYVQPAKANEPDANWSEVYGGNPNVGEELYPICTLTWDVGLKSALLAKLTEAEGTEAKNYLTFAVGTGAKQGQEEIAKNKGYGKLTTALDTTAKELVALLK